MNVNIKATALAAILLALAATAAPSSALGGKTTEAAQSAAPQCMARKDPVFFIGSINLRCTLSCHDFTSSQSAMVGKVGVFTKTDPGCTGIAYGTFPPFIEGCAGPGPAAYCTIPQGQVDEDVDCTGYSTGTMAFGALACQNVTGGVIEPTVPTGRIHDASGLFRLQALAPGDQVCNGETCILAWPDSVLAILNGNDFAWYQCGASACEKVGQTRIA